MADGAFTVTNPFTLTDVPHRQTDRQRDRQIDLI